MKIRIFILPILLIAFIAACNVKPASETVLQDPSLEDTDNVVSADGTEEIIEEATQEFTEPDDTSNGDAIDTEPIDSSQTYTLSTTNTNTAGAGGNTQQTSSTTNTTTTNTSQTGYVPPCEPHSYLPTYVVASGDTLSRIARGANTTTAELARLNCLQDVNVLTVGQVLYVPNLPIIIINTPVNNTQSCLIYINRRTEVVNTSQGTGRTILGYLEAGAVVQPIVQFDGSSYYGIRFNQTTGWVNVAPTGNCNNIPDTLPNTGDDCFIYITRRTEVVDTPQGTGRTILGYLEVGAVVRPTLHFEGLVYWGIQFNQVIGWVDVAPSGACDNIPTTGPHTDPPPNNTGVCVIRVSNRTEIVDTPQGTGRTILGYLEAGATTAPVLIIDGLSYYGIHFNQVVGWVNVAPSGDCSSVPRSFEEYEDRYNPQPEPSTFACYIEPQNSVSVYSQPDAGSPVMTTLAADTQYEVVAGAIGRWYRIAYDASRRQGWTQIQPQGDCAAILNQSSECTFVIDAPVPMYREPEIAGNQWGRTEVGERYTFMSYAGEWRSGDATGYWVEVFYNSSGTGYVTNTGGHLEGDCPTR